MRYKTSVSRSAVKRFVILASIAFVAVAMIATVLYWPSRVHQASAAQIESLATTLASVSSKPSNTDAARVSADSSVDYFLKIDGIQGESTDKKHKDEIDVLSWSWGETNSGTANTGGGGGAGKVNMQDLSFTKYVDKASPKLMIACATGQHINNAVLTVRKAGGGQPTEYITIKLTDVMVTSYQIEGPSGSQPEDSFSLSFGKIEFDYVPQNVGGAPSTPEIVTYDLAQAKAGIQ